MNHSTINVSAPINELSYGIVSRNIIKNLSKYTKVCLSPIDMSQHLYSEYFEYLQNYYEDFYMDSPSLRIFHENMLMQHMGKGPRIGFPFFEKDIFDSITRFNLNNQDLVLVASEWAKNVVEHQTNQKNIEVVNLGVDDIFCPDNTVFKQEKITFLNIGKYEIRKGHDLLGQYFAEAFEGVDDVQLWCSFSNPFLKPEEFDQCKLDYRKLLGGKFQSVPRLSQKDLVKLINSADIGVFLSRAEGWNMPLLECMACGKDIVATNYSAHTEYLPDCPGVFKIDPVSNELANDGKWFFGDFTWMNLEACRDSIIESLRAAYKRQKEKREINLYVREHSRRYNWNRTAIEILDSIKQL